MWTANRLASNFKTIEGPPPNLLKKTTDYRTMFCHYGNIAYRTTGALKVDSKTGRLAAGQDAAQKLWQGEAYRKAWEI
ncbi:MAG: hypothetical protein GXP30_08545 [Verrucomicrobia bacterium]|nr:hypothetical protein [Verrucomicrobiota bacterium]